MERETDEPRYALSGWLEPVGVETECVRERERVREREKVTYKTTYCEIAETTNKCFSVANQ